MATFQDPINEAATKFWLDKGGRSYQGWTCPVCVSEKLARQALAIKNLAMFDQTLAIPTDPSIRPA